MSLTNLKHFKESNFSKEIVQVHSSLVNEIQKTQKINIDDKPTAIAINQNTNTI